MGKSFTIFLVIFGITMTFENRIVKAKKTRTRKETTYTISEVPTVTQSSTATTDASCAVEMEKATNCGSKKGKSSCCSGLVCHDYQYWRCVREEHKKCAGPRTLAQECGSKWRKSASYAHTPYSLPYTFYTY